MREIANRLRSDAQVDEERFIPADRAEERPRVSYAPALVLRERRPTAYDDLIRKLLESADDGGLEATRPWSLLLREGELPEDVAGDLGLNRDHDAPGRGVPERFLFPLPANDDQREIVHRLHHNPCVLVKGPPGTGKSHTIANLICHLLAMGDRILVTAQAPKALAVLGGLLPADVRDLSVTALGSSREDQRHLEESVRGILRRKNEWRGPAHDQDVIDRTEKRLLALEGELAKSERFLRESREAETHPHALPGGYQGTAAQIARRLDEQREQHGWLPDRDDPDDPFPLDGAETAFLAEMHARLDEETLAELRLEVGAAQLPEPDRFKALVATTAAAEESAARVAGTAVPEKVEALGQSSSESLDALRSTLVDLESLAAKATRLLGDLTETILADLLAGSVDRWNRLALETKAFSPRRDRAAAPAWHDARRASLRGVAGALAYGRSAAPGPLQAGRASRFRNPCATGREGDRVYREIVSGRWPETRQRRAIGKHRRVSRPGPKHPGDRPTVAGCPACPARL